jgi:signal transduction histidine kinase
MLKDDLLNSHITISKEFEDKISLVGIENEFEHLVLNIINYIKDSFLINNIEKRHINIKLFYKKDAVILEISNSAGNIDNDIINKLFDIDSGVHSGIDLYMSQEIAQKHNGVLRVKNIKNGSLFHFETL